MSSGEQTISNEKKLVKTICFLAFIFSFGLAMILLIVSRTGVSGEEVNNGLAYFLAGGFLLVGSLFQFWQPINVQKLAVYLASFSVLGALFSAYILGYDFAIIYPPWITLFFTAYMFFKKKAYFIYIAFLLGGVLWLIDNQDRLSPGDIVNLVISSLFMILLFALMITVWEIADRRADRLEEAKKAEEVGRKRLVALVDSMQDAVIATNAQGIIQIYNRSTLRLFDLNYGVVGHSIGDLIRITDTNKEPIEIMNLVDKITENKVYTNLFYNFKDGDSITLSVSVAPIKLSFFNEGAGGFAFIISDITKKKSLDDQRQEFISVASHELRTPLASAEGNLSIALLPEYGPISDKATGMIKRAYDNIRQLSKIAADLTTLSEAERGMLRIELALIDPSDIVRVLAKENEKIIKDKGLELKLDISSDVKAVLTSRFRIQEILNILLNNAIKYTNNGAITIGVKSTQDGVQFWVQDTGIGISKADQAKIFDEFYRSEDFHTRETGGTGLGLFIAKKLADRLKATITLESHINKGSVFYLNVPNYTKKEQPSVQ